MKSAVSIPRIDLLGELKQGRALLRQQFLKSLHAESVNDLVGGEVIPVIYDVGGDRQLKVSGSVVVKVVTFRE